jgi:hypothetical protein
VAIFHLTAALISSFEMSAASLLKFILSKAGPRIALASGHPTHRFVQAVPSSPLLVRVQEFVECSGRAMCATVQYFF